MGGTAGWVWLFRKKSGAASYPAVIQNAMVLGS